MGVDVFVQYSCTEDMINFGSENQSCFESRPTGRPSTTFNISTSCSGEARVIFSFLSGDVIGEVEIEGSGLHSITFNPNAYTDSPISVTGIQAVKYTTIISAERCTEESEDRLSHVTICAAPCTSSHNYPNPFN